MKQEEILRQEAIRLHLQGMSAILIVSQLNRTRQWVYKWLKNTKSRPVKIGTRARRNPALNYCYVVAEIILGKYVLVVSQNASIHHIFPFAMSLP